MDEGDLGEEAFGNAEGIEEEKEDLLVSEKAVSYEEEHKEEIAELDKEVVILEPEKAMGAENAEERSYIFEPEKASSNVEENEEHHGMIVWNVLVLITRVCHHLHQVRLESEPALRGFPKLGPFRQRIILFFWSLLLKGCLHGFEILLELGIICGHIR